MSFVLLSALLLLTSATDVAAAYNNGEPKLLKRCKARCFTKNKILPSLEGGSVSESSSLAPHARKSWGDPIPCVYTNEPQSLLDWLTDNVPMNCCSTLGFDVESNQQLPWRPHKSAFYGPATIQLATPYSAIVVHMATRWRKLKTCWPIVDSVLRDPSIVKAGVAIDDDLFALYEQFSEGCVNGRAASRLDLGGLRCAGEVFDPSHTIGLKRLSESILGVELRKSRKIRRSDWSRVPLTTRQVVYSARDAWVAAAVVAELERRDPEKFGALQLMRVLAKRERPLDEVRQSRQKRKHAKNKLKLLMGKGVKGVNPELYSPAKRRRVERQLSILDANPAWSSVSLEIPEERTAGSRLGQLKNHSFIG